MSFWNRRHSHEKQLRSLEESIQGFRNQLQELEAHRSQLEGILQSMTEGVLVVGPDERLLLVNESARQILGIQSQIKAGVTFTEAARFPGLLELSRQVLREGEKSHSELELYAPQERILQVHASPCRIPAAGLCALLVFHDITELKRLERVRQEFVANVSHELKTPLTTIRAATETLLDGAAADPKAGPSFLSAIQEETARLQRLVDDLLSLAEVESQRATPEKEAISLRSFLEERIERHRSAAEARKVSLHLECGPLDRPLRASRRQLAQVVDNLLDNAIKYNRSDGTVFLKAAESENCLTLEVEDTGIGIPPKDLPRIFGRFYRVDKARSRETGGTGLGLAIVKHVAEAHGGSVRAESEFGRGSRFILTFPL
ncbi:MAG: PAS-domain containing protein [Candidatus Omnitrophica bacterium]|nr:PAS-domain containing protein [Candidatus Omnitrophota bacterium]